MNTPLQDTMIEPPNYTYGWYAPLTASEVTKKKITGFNFMGRTLIAFRNNEEKVCVLDSVCPHFGADLSKGSVCDGEVRCYFHGFYFNDEGQCTKGDLVKDPSSLSKIKVDKYAVEEVAGQIWIWHGPKPNEPARPLPFKDLNWDEWTTPVTSKRRTISNSNMCYLTENIIDMQHFDTVHKWKVHELVADPHINEQGFFCTDIKVTVLLGAQSPTTWVRVIGNLIRLKTRIRFEVYGPGSAIATSNTGHEINDKRAGRNIVCIYPLDEKNISIRVACCYKKNITQTPVNRLINKINKPIGWLAGHVTSRIAVSDFDGDLKVWNNRKYLTHPKYVKEDGPMILFRKWYLRFWHPDYYHEISNPKTTGKKYPNYERQKKRFNKNSTP